MPRRIRPGITVEDQENKMISLAMDVAEERLANGKASDQLVVHYLKLGSSKARLEAEKLRSENELLRAKADAIESQKETEKLYREAISAFGRYHIKESDEYED